MEYSHRWGFGGGGGGGESKALGVWLGGERKEEGKEEEGVGDGVAGLRAHHSDSEFAQMAAA